MAFRLPSHLHRARSGVLHFRIAIPPDLRQHFTVREIYRSLNETSDELPELVVIELTQAEIERLRSKEAKEEKPTTDDDVVDTVIMLA